MPKHYCFCFLSLCHYLSSVCFVLQLYILKSLTDIIIFFFCFRERWRWWVIRCQSWAARPLYRLSCCCCCKRARAQARARRALRKRQESREFFQTSAVHFLCWMPVFFLFKVISFCLAPPCAFHAVWEHIHYFTPYAWRADERFRFSFLRWHICLETYDDIIDFREKRCLRETTSSSSQRCHIICLSIYSRRAACQNQNTY